MDELPPPPPPPPPPRSSQPFAAVVLVCGLPASGKSTFARTLIDLHKRRDAPSNIGQDDDRPVCRDKGDSSDIIPTIAGFDNIVLIDYDAIAQRELTLCNGNNFKKVANAMQNTSFEDNDLEAWRRSRVQALQTLKDALTRNFSSASSLLILLDDNFHLRSMRRDVYRSCQETLEHNRAQIGFSTLYFSASLQVCIERNSLRSGKERIPIDVMTRMASVMEPPDESKPYASFERFHVSIDNTGSTLGGDVKALEDIDQCICNSLQSPISPKKIISQEEIARLEEERLRQREETLKNQTQRADQLLRRLVGAVGRVEKKRSKDANESRKKVMERVRKQDNAFDASDDSVVHHFACLVLGKEEDSDWHDLDNPIVNSINDAWQQFQSDRKESQVIRSIQ